MTDAEIVRALAEAVERGLPGAVVQAAGGGGHFSLSVVAPVFAGKSMVESHRLVYAAIAPLMSGDGAPVHAIDRLVTKPA